MLVAGVDVGGTNIEVGLVDDRHRVRERGKRNTPRSSPRKVARAIIKLIEELGDAPSAIGIGIPGVVHKGRVLEAPNLAGWDASFDIVKVMTNGNFGTQVLANDMYARAFGNFDIGRGASLAVILFISVLPVMYLNIRRTQKAEL